MALTYDAKYGRAVDEDRAVLVGPSGLFMDSLREFPYRYQCKDFSFDFICTTQHAWREISFQGHNSKQRLQIAVYIVEPTVRDGLRQALGKEVEAAFYDEIKSDLREGIYAIATMGGQILSFVPDYRVEFVQKISDVPDPV